MEKIWKPSRISSFNFAIPKVFQKLLLNQTAHETANYRTQ